MRATPHIRPAGEYINRFMPLSDGEKASLKCQAGVEELNESEPYDDIPKE